MGEQFKEIYETIVSVDPKFIQGSIIGAAAMLFIQWKGWLKLGSQAKSDIDYEKRISSLEAEMAGLKDVNADLATQNQKFLDMFMEAKNVEVK